MTGPMPYVVEKAAYISVIESRLSDLDERISALRQLRLGAPISTLCGFDSTNLGAPPDSYTNDPGFGDRLTPAQRLAHLDGDWFGMNQNANQAWVKQPGAFPTGFWRGFQGDPEAILREAIERAIEVSLDLAPGADVEDPCCLNRQWPIDLYWICQGPVFQCWVLWRKDDEGSSGHVTLLMTTPMANGHPLTSKITRPVTGVIPYRREEYASPPPTGSRRDRQGMWVVGHEDYQKVLVTSTNPTNIGEILWPRTGWKALSTDVVCVRPAEWEGGVLHDGRPYNAP
jgi:hypothetical protein